MFAVLHHCNPPILHPHCDDDDSLAVMKTVYSAHHLLIPCVYDETNKQKHEHVLPHFLLFLSECSHFRTFPFTLSSFTPSRVPVEPHCLKINLRHEDIP